MSLYLLPPSLPPSQNELQYQDVVQLSVPGEVLEGPEGTRTAAISQSSVYHNTVVLLPVCMYTCS